jgi:hypothetical protein
LYLSIEKCYFAQTGVVPIAPSQYSVMAVVAEQDLAFQAGYPDLRYGIHQQFVTSLISGGREQ